MNTLKDFLNLNTGTKYLYHDSSSLSSRKLRQCDDRRRLGRAHAKILLHHFEKSSNIALVRRMKRDVKGSDYA